MAEIHGGMKLGGGGYEVASMVESKNDFMDVGETGENQN